MLTGGVTLLCCVVFCVVFSDSDSDSELSVDEHSSSYASSHSSDSEDDDDDDEVHMKPKWNNERQPLHSTPKGPAVYLLIRTGLS